MNDRLARVILLPVPLPKSTMREKIAEYHDLFWFNVLGSLPLIGDRLADFRSDWNYRRV